MENKTDDTTRDDPENNGLVNSETSDYERSISDNKNNYELENSANGLDSEQVRGGQEGRNIRGIGSTDMDGKNGVLRMGDQSNSTMEVTPAGAESAIVSEAKTDTATVDVTTAGPDDYASTDQVDTPKAEEAAKNENNSQKVSKSPDEAQSETDEDIAKTGTDLNNQPVY